MNLQKTLPNIRSPRTRYSICEPSFTPKLIKLPFFHPSYSENNISKGQHQPLLILIDCRVFKIPAETKRHKILWSLWICRMQIDFYVVFGSEKCGDKSTSLAILNLVWLHHSTLVVCSIVGSEIDFISWMSVGVGTKKERKKLFEVFETLNLEDSLLISFLFCSLCRKNS